MMIDAFNYVSGSAFHDPRGATIVPILLLANLGSFTLYVDFVISSSHVAVLLMELTVLDVIRTNKKICHYIDIPLQHISDSVLV